jgi:hypothetical protein
MYGNEAGLSRMAISATASIVGVFAAFFDRFIPTNPRFCPIADFQVAGRPPARTRCGHIRRKTREGEVLCQLWLPEIRGWLGSRGGLPDMG